jgi:hypothetical protein
MRRNRSACRGRICFGAIAQGRGGRRPGMSDFDRREAMMRSVPRTAIIAFTTGIVLGSAPGRTQSSGLEFLENGKRQISGRNAHQLLAHQDHICPSERHDWGGDRPAPNGRCGGVGGAFMVGTSWYQRKADECALSAENSDDPRHRSRMEAESRLWRQIFVRSPSGRNGSQSEVGGLLRVACRRPILISPCRDRSFSSSEQRAGGLPRRRRGGLQLPDGSQAHQRTDRADDARQHAGERRAVARRDVLAVSPPGDLEHRPVIR